MKSKHAAGAVALAIVLSAPATFAQKAVVAASGPIVTSGSGVVVAPGVRDLTPALAAAPVHAAMVPAGTTTTVEGDKRTIVTRYWVDVPDAALSDPRFLRWQALR